MKIHDDPETEHVRDLINRRRFYLITLNGIAFEPVGKICISYTTEESVRGNFLSESLGKPTHFTFSYYDETYYKELEKGIVELFKMKNTDIPNSWNLEGFTKIKHTLFDHEKGEYIDTEVFFEKLR